MKSKWRRIVHVPQACRICVVVSPWKQASLVAPKHKNWRMQPSLNGLLKFHEESENPSNRKQTGFELILSAYYKRLQFIKISSSSLDANVPVLTGGFETNAGFYIKSLTVLTARNRA